jgi:uncharacterized membrane protein YGL010W
MGVLSNYFNLKKSFPFYGAYHRDGLNQALHVAFVPAIFSTALSFVSRVPLFGGVTLADAAAVFYGSSFIVMEPLAGLLYAPVIAGLWYAGTTFFAANPQLAIGIHVAGWLAQFAGHAYEGRKPALLDNLPQSLHAAVFFVWLEVLFALGYKPQLKKELELLVDQEAAKFSKTA